MIAVETFGTPQTQALLRRWREAAADEDEQRMNDAYHAMINLARRELGAQHLGDSDPMDEHDPM